MWKITTYPDLVVVCGLKKMVQEMDQVLVAKSRSPQFLSYDTTFQLGHFYVSSLLFRHIAFETSPVMPAIFLIHEWKFQSVHEELMEMVGANVPALRKGKHRIPIVVDEESGIRNAIKQFLPNSKRLQCWNHTINAAKAWLKKHGATSSEVPVYVSHIRELFHQPSEKEYVSRLEELRSNWSQAFSEYYTSDVHPKVYTCIY